MPNVRSLSLVLSLSVTLLFSACKDRNAKHPTSQAEKKPIAVAYVTGTLDLGKLPPPQTTEAITIHVLKDIDDRTWPLLSEYNQIAQDLLAKGQTAEMRAFESQLNALKKEVPRPITEQFVNAGGSFTSSRELYDQFNQTAAHFSLEELDQQLQAVKEAMLRLMQERESIRNDSHSTAEQKAQALADALWIEALAQYMSTINEISVGYQKAWVLSPMAQMEAFKATRLKNLETALFRFPSGSGGIDKDYQYAFEAEQDGPVLVEIRYTGNVLYIPATDNLFDLKLNGHTVELRAPQTK